MSAFAGALVFQRPLLVHYRPMKSFDEKKFAAIADIHGNADALSAVLCDIDAQGVRTIVNLGDHFSGPLAARETAEILLARDLVSIRGNHDRWLVEQDVDAMGPSDRAAYEQLAPDHLRWLRALPATLALGDDVFLCHGTPMSDMTYWLEGVSADAMVSFKSHDEIAREIEGIDAALILCGHTHLPRRVDLKSGHTILNPGSVGCPGYDDDLPVYHVMQSGTPTACYAIIERVGEGWITTIRNVPYDPSRMARMAREAGRDDWADALATGWIR